MAAVSDMRQTHFEPPVGKMNVLHSVCSLLKAVFFSPALSSRLISRLCLNTLVISRWIIYNSGDCSVSFQLVPLMLERLHELIQKL